MRANTLLAAAALMAGSALQSTAVAAPDAIASGWSNKSSSRARKSKNTVGKQAANRVKKKAAHRARMAQKGRK